MTNIKKGDRVTWIDYKSDREVKGEVLKVFRNGRAQVLSGENFEKYNIELNRLSVKQRQGTLIKIPEVEERSINHWEMEVDGLDLPPTSLPPTNLPPTEVPPTEVPPTNLPPTDSIEDTICDLVFTEWNLLPSKLKVLGIDFELYENGQSLFIDNGKLRAGLMDSDPITKAVQFGFSLLGERWAERAPNLLERINKQWKLTKRNKDLPPNNLPPTNLPPTDLPPTDLLPGHWIEKKIIHGDIYLYERWREEVEVKGILKQVKRSKYLEKVTADERTNF